LLQSAIDLSHLLLRRVGIILSRKLCEHHHDRRSGRAWISINYKPCILSYDTVIKHRLSAHNRHDIVEFGRHNLFDLDNAIEYNHDDDDSGVEYSHDNDVFEFNHDNDV
jgi:hypothetical protein